MNGQREHMTGIGIASTSLISIFYFFLEWCIQLIWKDFLEGMLVPDLLLCRRVVFTIVDSSKTNVDLSSLIYEEGTTIASINADYVVAWLYTSFKGLSTRAFAISMHEDY